MPTLAVVLAAAAALALASASGAVGSKTKPRCFGQPTTIVGTAGPDFLSGTAQPDVIATLGGGDTVTGGGGTDLICTGAGDDVVDGGAGNDRLDGGAGDDIIQGGPGIDVISAGPGFDTCRAAERRTGCEELQPRLPARPGEIASGAYVTDLFRPRFSIRLDPGWHLGPDKESNANVDLRRPELVVRVYSGLWFDSLSSKTPVQERVNEIRSVAALGPGPVSQTTIGGRPAQQFDLTPPAGTPETILPGMTHHYYLTSGDHARVWIVDVGGKSVFVAAGSEGERFDALLPLAERALATLKWH